MTNATSIMYNAIMTYVGPFLSEAGYRVNPMGILEDRNGGKIMYQNSKWSDGCNDPQIPPIIFPVIPIQDKDYLNIKLTPEYELFNPFMYLKHAAIVLIKLKKALIPFAISAEKQSNCDEEGMDALDDYLVVSNKRNKQGNYEIEIVNTEYNPPKTVIKYASEDPVKSIWCLCALIFVNYCDSNLKRYPQFKNLDKSWKKIMRLMADWDKARKSIIVEVKQSQNDATAEEDLDLSLARGDKTIEDIIVEKFNRNYYLETNDGSDINDPILQDYLTSLFSPESFTPYVPPAENLEIPEDKCMTTEETIVVTNPSQIEQAAIEDNISANIFKANAEVEKKRDETKTLRTSGNSIFRKMNTQEVVQNTPMSPYGGTMMYGFGMNPYGMNMGQIPANIPEQTGENINVGSFVYVNPFA